MLRYEYKYIVPYSRLEALRHWVSAFAKKDPYAVQKGEYTVKSIYFDSVDLECYQLKVSGIKRRNKVRLRGYNFGDGESKVFFEIKKKVDEPLYKNRAGLPYEIAVQLLRGQTLTDEDLASRVKAPDFLEAQRFLYHIFARKLQPVINVIYEREPYQFKNDPVNDLRITFDKDLRGVRAPAIDELFDEKYPIGALNGHFIMEVKFNRYLPAWVRQLVVSQGLKKGPASKYTLCMDAVRRASELDYKLSVGRWQMGKIL